MYDNKGTIILYADDTARKNEVIRTAEDGLNKIKMWLDNSLSFINAD